MDQYDHKNQDEARTARAKDESQLEVERAIKAAAMGKPLILAPTTEDAPQTQMRIMHRVDPVAGPIVLFTFDPPVPYMVLLPEQAAALGGQLLERAGIVKHLKHEQEKKNADKSNADSSDGDRVSLVGGDDRGETGEEAPPGDEPGSG